MRRFYLFRRNQKNKIYYVQLVNPLTGERMPAKSTGCTDRDEAHFTVMSWLKAGFIPSGDNKEGREAIEVFSIDDILFKLRNTQLTDKDTEKIIQVLKDKGLIQGANISGENQQTLLSFLLNFWTWEKSPYVAEKKAYKQSISKYHVNGMRGSIETYWKPYFDSSLPLSDLTREMLREFSIALSKRKKQTRGKEPEEREETLSARTCNVILQAGTVALNWAFNNGVIQTNPAAGLKKFGFDAKKRGILTDKEMKKLFTSGDWHNHEGAKLAALLASQTGLRLGEVIALRVRDIDSDRIQVKHSYSTSDGLKSTKTGETRQVPIIPETKKAITEYAKKNPFGFQPDNFIFFKVDDKNIPMRGDTVSKLFNNAVDSILSETERKARNIVFHGLRHYYAKKMADVLDQRAAKLTGHKTAAMLEHYANHEQEEDFQKAIQATNEVFGHVINFPEKKESAG